MLNHFCCNAGDNVDVWILMVCISSSRGSHSYQDSHDFYLFFDRRNWWRYYRKSWFLFLSAEYSLYYVFKLQDIIHKTPKIIQMTKEPLRCKLNLGLKLNHIFSLNWFSPKVSQNASGAEWNKEGRWVKWAHVYLLFTRMKSHRKTASLTSSASFNIQTFSLTHIHFKFFWFQALKEKKNSRLNREK